MYAWQGAYQCAVLDTDSRKMASRIDAALRAIEQRVRSAIRIDEAESVAIEAARSRSLSSGENGSVDWPSL